MTSPGPTSPGTRIVPLPDLDDEITHALTVVEEVLLSLGAADDVPADPEDAPLLPAPLADGAALAAVRRLWDALAPSQGERARKAGLGALYAPDGRYEHVPLRLVDVDPADVHTLAATAQALGDPHAEDWIRDTVTDLAEALLRDERHPAQELVSLAARLAGILDLADTGDTKVLLAALADADPTANVVLTSAQETAYRATVTRINHMWTLANPLDRWKY